MVDKKISKRDPQNSPGNPVVYRAVRAVGILRPKAQVNPSGLVFANALDVIATAFWLREEKVLITCAHVVENLLGDSKTPVEATGLLFVGNKGNYTRAKIGVIDFIHDIAVLLLEADEATIAREAVDGLEILHNYPNVGEEVAYAAFPLGHQLLNSTHAPTYAEGVIGAQLRHHGRRKDVQVAGAVVGGFSGSPVVLKKNDKLVGVLSNSPSKEAGNASIFMATAWEHVAALAKLATS